MDNSEQTTFETDKVSTSAEIVQKDKKFISKRRLIYLLKFVITILVMVLLVKHVKLNNILNAFKQANHFLIALAFLSFKNGSR